MDLQKHRNEDFVEFTRYKNYQDTSPNDSDIYHFAVEFVEKFLIPHMLNQSGQLHLITGLKFYVNMVCSSKTGQNYMFGLPEGHWPNEKPPTLCCKYCTMPLGSRKKALWRPGSTLFCTAAI